MRPLTLAAALAAALGAAGCGRAHLNSHQGEASRKAFSAQAVSPPMQWRAPQTALDAQEAEVVAESYLRSLAGKTRSETPEPVLYVAPPQRAPQAPLAPSVPKG